MERHLASLAVVSTSTRRQEADFVRQYKSQLRAAHGYIVPPDFDRRRKIPIINLYVSPDISGGATDSRPLTVLELAKCTDRTVLLGDPGGGKSTAGQWIIHHYASEEGTRVVPLLVVLRDFARDDGEPGRSILQYIEDRLNGHYQCKPPAGLIERLLLEGSAFVVFDGLDELIDTTRRSEVTEKVELFCNRYPLARVLVTSRRIGYDQAPMDRTQFPSYEIAGFSATQVEEYARKWFAQDEDVGESGAKQWADTFMRESDDVPELRSNPLMLALMCILYRGQGWIPKNRPDVYERCATMLFEKWDASRKIHVELKAAHLVEPALRHLAFWMFSKPDIGEGVTKGDLIRETAAFLEHRSFEDPDEAVVAAREFVDFCRGRAWVFSDAGSTGEGEALYAFTHRTFMEYFAGSYLASAHDTPERLAQSLAPHLARSEWDVVGQLAVQIKNKSSMDGAQRIYSYLLDERRRRSSIGRGQILSFLSRCLTFYEPPPALTRQLVREVVSVTIALRGEPGHDVNPLGWLLGSCQASRGFVRDELAQIVATLIGGDEQTSVLDGLALAAELRSAVVLVTRGSGGASREDRDNYWRVFSEELLREHEASLRDAARSEPSLASVALRDGLLSVEDFVQGSRPRLRQLFSETRWRLLRIRSGPYLPFLTRRLVLGDEAGREVAIRQFAGVARAVEGMGSPPWLTKTSSVMLRHMPNVWADVSSGSRAGSVSRILKELPEDAYFGFAVVLAILFEQPGGARRDAERFLRGPHAAAFPARERAAHSRTSLPGLGVLEPSANFGPLGAYFARRSSLVGDVSLPKLPISKTRWKLMVAWAENQVDFVDHPLPRANRTQGSRH